jgi:hypothetical protein
VGHALYDEQKMAFRWGYVTRNAVFGILADLCPAKARFPCIHAFQKVIFTLHSDVFYEVIEWINIPLRVELRRKK